MLARFLLAVRDGGLLAVSLKLGDGERWSTERIGLPRHFSYWREGPVRAALSGAGWAVTSCEQADGRQGPWLYVIAQRAC